MAKFKFKLQSYLDLKKKLKIKKNWSTGKL
jgi:hypothetical protein